MSSEVNGSNKLLRMLEVTYQSVLDNVFDAIIMINAEGMVTAWNRRAESMFGWTAKEALGKPLFN